MTTASNSDGTNGTNGTGPPTHAAWTRRPGERWRILAKGSASACWKALFDAGKGCIGARDTMVLPAGEGPDAPGRRKIVRFQNKGGLRQVLFPEPDAESGASS